MDVEMEAEVKVPKPRFYEALQPLSHLLLSNEVPSDSELKQLAALRRDIRREYREFTAGLAIDKSRLLQYDPLRTLRGLLRGAMSPIRRLPDEIISKIFLMCLPFSRGMSCNVMSPGRSPWKLARVCKRWRAIALGDQRLWSSINLDDISDESSPTLPMLIACLARSGQHPLNIRNWYTPNLSLLIHLSAYSDRWVHLEIVLDADNFELMKRMMRIKERLPELQEVYIRAHVGDFPGEAANELKQVFDLFEFAPKLRKATIYHTRACIPEHLKSPANPGWLVLPWHQLTRLETDSTRVLSRCHQVVDCRLFRIMYMEKELEGVDELITLPNLRRLTVGNTELIGNLVLPSLESLYLAVRQNYPHVAWEHIHSLIIRSRCPLKTLDMGDVQIRSEEDSDLCQIIADCPNLLTVRIDGPCNRRFISKLGDLLPDWHLDDSDPYIWDICRRVVDWYD